MKILGTLFLFGGYCLVYAAVAHGGKFATDPWNGIFADAYVDMPNDSGAATAAGSGAAVGSAAGAAIGSGASAGAATGATAGGATGAVRPRSNIPPLNVSQISSIFSGKSLSEVTRGRTGL